MNPIRHTIHRYEKAVLGKKGYTVFRCNLPDCNHYIRKELAKGKQSICNRCGNIFVLDRRAMRFVKPYCVDCAPGKSKNSDTRDKLLEFVEANDMSSRIHAINGEQENKS